MRTNQCRLSNDRLEAETLRLEPQPSLSFHLRERMKAARDLIRVLGAGRAIHWTSANSYNGYNRHAGSAEFYPAAIELASRRRDGPRTRSVVRTSSPRRAAAGAVTIDGGP